MQRTLPLRRGKGKGRYVGPPEIDEPSHRYAPLLPHERSAENVVSSKQHASSERGKLTKHGESTTSAMSAQSKYPTKPGHSNQQEDAEQGAQFVAPKTPEMQTMELNEPGEYYWEPPTPFHKSFKESLAMPFDEPSDEADQDEANKDFGEAFTIVNSVENGQIDIQLAAQKLAALGLRDNNFRESALSEWYVILTPAEQRPESHEALARLLVEIAKLPAAMNERGNQLTLRGAAFWSR